MNHGWNESRALLAAVACCLSTTGMPRAESPFVRGDSNVDGNRDLSDAVHMLGCNFLGTDCSPCSDAADTNDDGKLDITDPIYLLNFLFLGGAALAPPSDACGSDPTEDDLDCAAFLRCTPPPDPDAVPTQAGDLLVQPIEHASVILRWNGKVIAADPVGAAGKYAGVPAPRVLLVTHTHGDHMSRSTILALADPETIVVVPRAVSQALDAAGGLGALERRLLANGESTTVDDISIDAVPMYNARHAKGEGNGYVVKLGGTRVYFSGDTEDIPEMRALEDIGLAFVCMNLPFTMTPDKAASAVLEFKPRVVYPYHYRNQDGTADPNAAAFASQVNAAGQPIEVRLRDWYP